MRPIGGAIERALRKLGLERDMARVSAIDAWPDAARAIFGADAAVTHAVGLAEGTIVVTVPDTAWSGEIRLRETDLLAAIRERAEGSDIAHIRTVPANERSVKRPSDS
ncbi:MAG TPA: DciA family protein [Candidatus Limnocylindria bacterium]